MSDDSEEWGPWIEHDGKGNPLQDGAYIHGVEADGDEFKGFIERNGYCAEDEVFVWDWRDCRRKGRWDWRLIRYRIRKPRALLRMIEEAKKLDAPFKERAHHD